jgi:hypothetical protein
MLAALKYTVLDASVKSAATSGGKRSGASNAASNTLVSSK